MNHNKIKKPYFILIERKIYSETGTLIDKRKTEYDFKYYGETCECREMTFNDSGCVWKEKTFLVPDLEKFRNKLFKKNGKRRKTKSGYTEYQTSVAYLKPGKLVDFNLYKL